VGGVKTDMTKIIVAFRRWIKKILSIKNAYLFSIQILSKIFLRAILSEKCVAVHIKYTLLLSDFSEIRIFLTDFLKTPELQMG
jgi:hypothetical protein